MSELSLQDIEELKLAARRWEWSPKDTFVSSLAKLGPPGAEIIRDEALRRTDWSRVGFIAALGDVQGDVGIAELYLIASTDEGGSPDARCAALLALTKREGSGATEILITSLRDRSLALRSYALLGLAAVGEDGAWEPVHDRLKALIRRRPKVGTGPISLEDSAACYLMAHARGEDRQVRLVKTLRRLAEVAPDSQKMLQDLWPQVLDWSIGANVPEGRPEPEAIHRWIRESSMGLIP